MRAARMLHEWVEPTRISTPRAPSIRCLGPRGTTR